MSSSPTLDRLRHHATARNLTLSPSIEAGIGALGFVQADPMRAPARAQDLILRHRVVDYRAGDLEQRYSRLKIDEDCFVNYGFVPRATLALLHPREPRRVWDATTAERAMALLDFVRARGATHPKQLLEAFAHHGRMPGYWGGELNVSTQLLDGLHYRGHLRVKRRESGTRVYQAIAHPEQEQTAAAWRKRAEALVDMVVALYAPLPSASLGYLATLLRLGAPDIQPEVRQVVKAAKERYAHAVVEGRTWYWPADENPRSRRH